MDPRLSTLIADYLAAVLSAVKLLEEAGIPRPASNTAWVGTEIPQTGTLPGDVKYFKHGYGCAVHLKSGHVDFDFGANGQIVGFDVWRLGNFAEDRLHQYGFSSEKDLEATFAAAVASGQVLYSGYILHYLAAPNA